MIRIRKRRFKWKEYRKLNETDVKSEPEKISEEILSSLDETDESLQKLYLRMAESKNPSEYSGEVNTRLRSYMRTLENLSKAYHRGVAAVDELSARHRDLSDGRPLKLLPKAPANSVIDLEEERSNHFAKGMNIYKILIIGYIGSFAGVIIEMLWCLLNHGYIESRAGLVYGPFNLLYGAGAIIMSLALYRYRNNGRWLSFFGGFLVGGAVEYVCSYGQELLFGSRSWDYSHMPFNINGRVCLLYSVFWGILGVVWIKIIYPLTAELVLKLPQGFGKAITWVLLAFFVFNAAVTVIALFRWSQRLDFIEPANAFWKFIDMRFPNERMSKIFANMVFE